MSERYDIDDMFACEMVRHILDLAQACTDKSHVDDAHFARVEATIEGCASHWLTYQRPAVLKLLAFVRELRREHAK